MIHITQTASPESSATARPSITIRAGQLRRAPVAVLLVMVALSVSMSAAHAVVTVKNRTPQQCRAAANTLNQFFATIDGFTTRTDQYIATQRATYPPGLSINQIQDAVTMITWAAGFSGATVTWEPQVTTAINTANSIRSQWTTESTTCAAKGPRACKSMVRAGDAASPPAYTTFGPAAEFAGSFSTFVNARPTVTQLGPDLYPLALGWLENLGSGIQAKRAEVAPLRDNFTTATGRCLR